MSRARSLQAGLALLITVVAIGTVGFMLIEGMTAFDGFYLTVITISTLGFGPGVFLGTGGRAFAIVLLVLGLGGVLYTAVVGLELAVDRLLGGERQLKRMHATIKSLEGHTILCGFGQVGATAWQRLHVEAVDVVVIDSNPDLIQSALDQGAIAIVGDATHDGVLEQAGLDRAASLIAAVRSDSDNLVITLSAKARRPEILVVARAIDAEAGRKLFLAGADRVVAPQQVGAERLAALVLNTELAEFIDLVVAGRSIEFRVGEFRISESSPIIGQSLRDLDLRAKGGAMVIAAGRQRDQLVVNPNPGTVFRAGQVVVAVGSQEQLDALRTLTTVRKTAS
jgi:voltage-gated potassium channel